MYYSHETVQSCDGNIWTRDSKRQITEKDILRVMFKLKKLCWLPPLRIQVCSIEVTNANIQAQQNGDNGHRAELLGSLSENLTKARKPLQGSVGILFSMTRSPFQSEFLPLINRRIIRGYL